MYLAKHILSHSIWPRLQPRQKIVILLTFNPESLFKWVFEGPLLTFKDSRRLKYIIIFE